MSDRPAILLPHPGPLQPGTPRRVAYYFYRLRDDHLVREFCVVGAIGPQTVHTLSPDGLPEYWQQRDENGVLVFLPPSGYAGGQGLLWAYDKRLQRGEAMPRHLLERMALGMRMSVDLGGK
jgi:hypothetical protein